MLLAVGLLPLGVGEGVRPVTGEEGGKYEVKLLTGALPPSRRPSPSESVTMTRSDGRMYRCYLPASQNGTETGEESAPPPKAGVASYLAPLVGNCFYRLEGWWTYEFCFPTSIRQFHQEKTNGVGGATTRVTQNYTLGRYWKEESPSAEEGGEAGLKQAGRKDREKDGAKKGGKEEKEGREERGGEGRENVGKAGVKEEGKQGGNHGGTQGDKEGGKKRTGGVEDVDGELKEDAKTRRVYWKQSYGNGTHCDLTGRPRESEVRLLCASNEPSLLASVEEVTTCRYLVQFSSNLLCDHPSFAMGKKTDNVASIQCEPLDGEGNPLPAPKRSPAPPSQAKPSPPSKEEDTVGAHHTATAAAEQAGKHPRQVAYDLGQCIIHHKLNYRGAIVGYDPTCKQTEAWIRMMGVDGLKHGRNQPFYHVLPDTRDRPGAQITYVAQENVMPDTPPDPLQHPLLSEFFARFHAHSGSYEPTADLRSRFPVLAG